MKLNWNWPQTEVFTHTEFARFNGVKNQKVWSQWATARANGQIIFAGHRVAEGKKGKPTLLFRMNPAYVVPAPVTVIIAPVAPAEAPADGTVPTPVAAVKPPAPKCPKVPPVPAYVKPPVVPVVPDPAVNQAKIDAEATKALAKAEKEAKKVADKAAKLAEKEIAKANKAAEKAAAKAAKEAAKALAVVPVVAPAMPPVPVVEIAPAAAPAEQASAETPEPETVPANPF
jgi:hypothetical protein